MNKNLINFAIKLTYCPNVNHPLKWERGGDDFGRNFRMWWGHLELIVCRV
jgi:hypothetical protein